MTNCSVIASKDERIPDTYHCLKTCATISLLVRVLYTSLAALALYKIWCHLVLTIYGLVQPLHSKLMKPGVMWGSCEDHVTVMWGSCEDHVTVMWGSCESCDSHVTVTWGSCDSHVRIMWQSCDSHVSHMSHNKSTKNYCLFPGPVQLSVACITWARGWIFTCSFDNSQYGQYVR